MTSKKSAIIIAAILVVGGVLGYLFYRNQSDTSNTHMPDSSNASIQQTFEVATPLNDIPNYEAIKEKYALHLTPAQEMYFEKNRFLLVSENDTKFASSDTYNFDKMLSDFDTLGGDSPAQERKPADTVLVTPDIALHAYHKYFELTLEELEQKELSGTLSSFLTDLRSNLADAYKKSTGVSRQRYANLQAQIALAQVLLENKSPEKPAYFNTPEEETAYASKDKTIDTAQNAKRILKKYSRDLSSDLVSSITYDIDKIYASKEVGISPLFGQYDPDLKTDYTQFTPRSHYTKNSTLRAYFRTMMYLGRSSYGFKEDVGFNDATLLTEQFAEKAQSGKTPLESWGKIMDITGFYAGASDDITYTEMREFVTKVVGGGSASENDIASGSLAKTLRSRITELRKPKILSDVVVNEDITSKNKAELLKNSLSYRIFGQRFTFDAWILNDLTAGQEPSVPKLPSMPSALFVPAAMGDDRAKDHIVPFLQKNAGFTLPNVQKFMKKLKEKRVDIAKVTNAEWFSSFGSAWLYVLGSLKGNYGKEYPLYMQGMAFPDKQIQTFLGSFAELKHDTLLYAKQSYAEMGGGTPEGDVPPVVKGYVEPNLEFWHRFGELVDHTQEVFEKNGLFKDHAALERLKEFKTICTLFTSIATKELHNEAVSDDEYEMLRTKNLKFMSDPFDTIDPDDDSSKVALIADIHTDAVTGKILYEATAKPYLMLVAVGNENTPRVAAGLVYNHYELTGDLTKRLTDEDWRTWVYDQTEKLPLKNFWYDSLFAK